jgi:hypothetical protein
MATRGRPKKQNTDDQPVRGQRRDVINIEESSEDIVETKKLKREVKMSDEVLIMNNTSGQLVIVSTSTRRQWILKEYGKKARMTVSDIIDITSDQSNIFEEGWALILDDDVVNYLNYDELYKNLISAEKMANLFELSNKELDVILPNLPSSLKIDFARLVKQKIKSGAIDSRTKIATFQNHLKFELD